MMGTLAIEQRIRTHFIPTLASIWGILLLVIVLASLLSDRFLDITNIMNVLHQSVVVGIVAVGMTLVLILGHFDLSTGATVSMSAVLSIVLAPETGGSTFLAIALPLTIGIIIGALNGIVICYFKANSIIATLGMNLCVVGIVLAAVSGGHVRTESMTPFFAGLSGGSFLGIPVPVLILLTVVFISSAVAHFSIFGRHIYAIGGDLDAAHRAGINVTKTGIITFVISGALASVSGILIASRVGHLDPTGVSGYEFPALTAAVLGGARLTGGEGTPLNTLAAILVISIITNVMILRGYPHSSQLFVQGLILALAVAYTEFNRGETR